MKTRDIAADIWTEILSLFEDWSVLSPTEQQTKLSAADLPHQAKEVLSNMLDAANKPNFLDLTIEPLVEQLLGKESVQIHHNPANIIGRTFGVWKVTSELASGGMGQVFEAQRADGQFEKKVALKIIKSGGFSTLSKQRFSDEMRTLAQFEHPNIARLIDGGSSDDDIAYFVMELVHGKPITVYANQHQLNLQGRIELVQQAIEAVEYAHQNLVIHGDIKPANLLVNETGQIKLVDFGISRSLQNQPVSSHLPQYTPSYSAPEQSQGKPLSTATDVFGLCAVLYELCCGSPPRDQSTVTTQLDLEQQLDTPLLGVYQRFLNNLSKQSDPVCDGLKAEVVGKALAKELGSIIDKGLSRDVGQRYKNTTSLSRDLELFLRGEVVPSYGTSLLYRWQKFWTKFKIPVLLSAGAVVGIIGVALLALHQARLASDQSAKAQWANQFLLGIFAAADPVKNQQEPITVNELTGLAADKILKDNSDIELKIAALELLAQIQHRLGEIQSSEQLNAEQIKLLEQHKLSSEQLASAHIDAGQLKLTQNDFEQSLRHFETAMSMVPINQGINVSSVKAAMGVVDSLIRLDKPDEAEVVLAVLDDHEDDIASLENSSALMTTLYVLKAQHAKAKFDYVQAETNIFLAKSFATNVTDNAMLFPEVLSIEADIYFEQGESLKAVNIDRQLVAYFKEKFGASHPETIDSLSNLAVSLLSSGQISETIAVNLEIIETLNTAGITDHQEAASLLNLGIAYDIAGDYDAAIRNLKKAEAMWPELKPRYLYYDALTFVSLARTYLTLKQFDLAATYFDKSLATIETEYGRDNHRYAWFQIKYTSYLIAQGRFSEAEEIIPNAREKIAVYYAEDSKRINLVDLSWAKLLAVRGEQQAASQLAAKVLAHLDLPHTRDRYRAEVKLAKEIAGR